MIALRWVQTGDAARGRLRAMRRRSRRDRRRAISASPRGTIARRCATRCRRSGCRRRSAAGAAAGGAGGDADRLVAGCGCCWRRLAAALLAGGFAHVWPHCLSRPEGVSAELDRLWLIQRARGEARLYARLAHLSADRRAAAGRRDRRGDDAVADARIGRVRRLGDAGAAGDRRPARCCCGRRGRGRRRNCWRCRGRRRSPGRCCRG